MSKVVEKLHVLKVFSENRSLLDCKVSIYKIYKLKTSYSILS